MITDFSSIIRNILLLNGAKGLKSTAENVQETKKNTAQTAESVKETKDSINKSTQTNTKIYGKMNTLSVKSDEILNKVKSPNEATNNDNISNSEFTSSTADTPYGNSYTNMLERMYSATLKANIAKRSEAIQKQGDAEAKKQYEDVKRKGKENA